MVIFQHKFTAGVRYMKIDFSCPNCNDNVSIDLENLKDKLICTHCNNEIHVEDEVSIEDEPTFMGLDPYMAAGGGFKGSLFADLINILTGKKRGILGCLLAVVVVAIVAIIIAVVVLSFALDIL